MNQASRFTLSTSPPAQTGGKPPGLPALRCRRRLPCWGMRSRPTGKELDAETGLYYFGARYLDPKTARWISGDPAISEYIPSAPVNDEAKKRNGSLPGMGGVFNVVNLHVYHYAGNNPVKYMDPNGEESGYVTNEDAVAKFGHSGMFVQNENGKYEFFEVTGLVDNQKTGEQYTNNKTGEDEENTEVLSVGPLSFPTPSSGASALNTPNSGVVKVGEFDNFADMLVFLAKKGYTLMVIFPTSPEQDAEIHDAANRLGTGYEKYNVFSNNCGQWANNVLSTSGSGINSSNTRLPGPNYIGKKLLRNNEGFAYTLRMSR